jgi:hypothetical protein
VQPGMEQQAEQIGYDSWQRIKAARTLDQLRGGASKAFLPPFSAPQTSLRVFGKEAGSGGQRKQAAPQYLESPTSPYNQSPLLFKAALLTMQGKQPKVTATGESGLPDEIPEKPWSVYGGKAWPAQDAMLAAGPECRADAGTSRRPDARSRP